MNDVAKLLGVRIGETFEIDTKEGKFIFYIDGLYSMHAQDYCPDVLCQMLAGRLNIKSQFAKSWKPNYDQGYYIVLTDGTVVCEEWFNDTSDINYYKLGNCYCTAEEAEENRDKWVAFYASDEILEV